MSGVREPVVYIAGSDDFSLSFRRRLVYALATGASTLDNSNQETDISGQIETKYFNVDVRYTLVKPEGTPQAIIFVNDGAPYDLVEEFVQDENQVRLIIGFDYENQPTREVNDKGDPYPKVDAAHIICNEYEWEYVGWRDLDSAQSPEDEFPEGYFRVQEALENCIWSTAEMRETKEESSNSSVLSETEEEIAQCSRVLLLGGPSSLEFRKNLRKRLTKSFQSCSANDAIGTIVTKYYTAEIYFDLYYVERVEAIIAINDGSLEAESLFIPEESNEKLYERMQRIQLLIGQGEIIKGAECLLPFTAKRRESCLTYGIEDIEWNDDSNIDNRPLSSCEDHETIGYARIIEALQCNMWSKIKKIEKMNQFTPQKTIFKENIPPQEIQQISPAPNPENAAKPLLTFSKINLDLLDDSDTDDDELREFNRILKMNDKLQEVRTKNTQPDISDKDRRRNAETAAKDMMKTLQLGSDSSSGEGDPDTMEGA